MSLSRKYSLIVKERKGVGNMELMVMSFVNTLEEEEKQLLQSGYIQPQTEAPQGNERERL